jgi:hypothetical protein
MIAIYMEKSFLSCVPYFPHNNYRNAIGMPVFKSRQHESKALDWHTLFVPIIYLCIKYIKAINNSFKSWSF